MKTLFPETDSFWKMPAVIQKDWSDYIWIGPAEGFLVQAVTMRLEPPGVAPVAVHFVVNRPDVEEVKLAGSDGWVAHGIRREGETLWWTFGEKEVPSVFVPAQTVPQWAHNAFARGRAKLLRDPAEGSAP